jgi:hypothetical protein
VKAAASGFVISTQMFVGIQTTSTETQAAQKLVDDLSKEIQKLANDVAQKQAKWQLYYQQDLTKITNYIATDYRGTQWQAFQPKIDLASVHAQAAVTDPQSPADLKKINVDEPPSELDYAQIQADVDVIKTIQSRFTSRCSSATDAGGAAACDSGAVAALAASADQASAILSILQDNFKILQTAQTAVTSSAAALDKIYADFLFRKDNLHTIKLDRDTNVSV